MSVGSPQRSFLDGKSTEIDINTNSQQSAEDLNREISFVMDNDVIGAPMSDPLSQVDLKIQTHSF
jgi:hypothetical protein